MSFRQHQIFIALVAGCGIALLPAAARAELMTSTTATKQVNGVMTVTSSTPYPSSAALPESVNVQRVGEKYAVTFIHHAPQAKAVYLAGQFNHWTADKDAMAKSGNTWSLTVTLDEGEVPYKFVVDGKWTPDPLNLEGADDNNGGQNSLLRLGSAAQMKVSSEEVGDDHVNREALAHDPDHILYFNPVSDGTVVIKFKAAAHDLGSARLKVKNKSSFSEHLMSSEHADNRTETFRAKVPAAALAQIPYTSAPITVQYSISARDGKASVTLGTGTGNSGDFTRLIRKEEIFNTPDWASEVVWYQIFPERFRNGSAENDPKGKDIVLRQWTSDWWTRGEIESGRAMEPGVFGRRYGGDIQGIIEKLTYLKELGIGAIYLNPVFEAESLHKYEATDYRHIDDNFGFAGDYAAAAADEDLLTSSTWKFTKTDQLFLEFIRKAHEAGIKVVIDGVFNHTGTDHPAYQDILKNGKASAYADWFNVTSWNPIEVEGWAGVKGLPVLKEDNDGFVADSLEQHFMDITSRWMDPDGDGDPSDGIDGWRLDVPNEVSSEWWRRWRDHVKRVNPDAIIIGEIWDPPAKWLEGDQFDSVMNYQLAQALTRFFTNGGKATDLRQDVAKLLATVPDQANYAMMNLMNSHDTDRLVSQLNNPGRGYDARNRQQDVEPGQYSSAKPAQEVYDRLKQLTSVQFSLIGSPMIYYGDEAGMWGADDPEDRKPMIWKDLGPYENPEENHFMEDIHAHYQRLAALRNTFPALQGGDYQVLMADDNARLLVFKRSFKDEADVIIATNDSNTTWSGELPVGTTATRSYVDVLADQSVSLVMADPGDPRKTRLQISSDANQLLAADGKLKVQLAPRATSIFVSTR